MADEGTQDTLRDERQDAGRDPSIEKRLKRDPSDADAKIDGDILHISVPLPPDRRGRTTRSSDMGMTGATTKADLAALVRTAHQRLAEIHASPRAPAEHDRMKAPATAWIHKRIGIGLLAPDIQRALLTGTAPDHLTPEWLLSHEWPLDWEAQRKLIGMPA